jgi:hypothetical protein
MVTHGESTEGIRATEAQSAEVHGAAGSAENAEGHERSFERQATIGLRSARLALVAQGQALLIVILVLLLCLLCAGCSEVDAMPGIPPAQPVSPWHMWGTTQRIHLALQGVTLVDNRQLVRINYRRPDSWRFLFSAKIIGGSTPVAPNDDLVDVRFNVFAGLGRSVFNSDQVNANDVAFAYFHFLVPVGTIPGQQPQNTKYTTEVRAPRMIDPDDTTRYPLTVLPAQDLQVQVQTIFYGSSGATLDLEVGAYFAPNVHVRPDWWQPAHRPGPHGDPVAASAQAVRFLGTETGGT